MRNTVQALDSRRAQSMGRTDGSVGNVDHDPRMSETEVGTMNPKLILTIAGTFVVEAILVLAIALSGTWDAGALRPVAVSEPGSPAPAPAPASAPVTDIGR